MIDQTKMNENNSPAAVGRWLQSQTQNIAPTQTQSIENRTDLLEKTKSLRTPGEDLRSFIARTGLSPSQLFNWRIDRLADWIAMLKRNAEEGPADAVEPKFTIGG
jgi:hypothetical protein